MLCPPENDTETSDYRFSLTVPGQQLRIHAVVDGLEFGGAARFVNNCCALPIEHGGGDGKGGANMDVHRVLVEHNDNKLYRVGFFACRDIAAGSELTICYGEKRSEGGKVLGGQSCACATCKTIEDAKRESKERPSKRRRVEDAPPPPLPRTLSL